MSNTTALTGRGRTMARDSRVAVGREIKPGYRALHAKRARRWRSPRTQAKPPIDMSLVPLLSRFGLHCATVEDEKAFADSFLRGTVRESQAFLIFSALFVYIFSVWDRIIDPLHWQTTHMLRGLVISPMLVLAALALFTPFARRHFEALIVI